MRHHVFNEKSENIKLNNFTFYTSLRRAFRAFTLIKINDLRVFILSCVVLLQFKGKVPMFCVCAPINHSPPVSLLSFILLLFPSCFHAFFQSFILSHFYFFNFFILNRWLHYYLYKYFAATFSDFLCCFLSFFFELNITNIQFSHISHVDRYCNISS